jgi:hypothetical protein
MLHTGTAVRSASSDIMRSNSSETIPFTANGAQYCHFISANSYQAWYTEAYILEGTCSEGILCESGGNFSVYSTGICNTSHSISMQYQLSNTTSNYNFIYTDSIYRYSRNVSVFATYGTMVGGHLQYMWQELVPPSTAVFEGHQNSWEVFAATAVVLAFVLLSINISIISTRIHRKQQRNDILHLIGQLMWTLVLAVKLADVQLSFKNIELQSLMTSLVLMLPNFATLYSSMHCLLIILQSSGLLTVKNVGTVTAFLILHLATAGSQYIYAVIPLQVYLNWRAALVIWNVFALLTIMSPIGYFIYKVIKNKDRVYSPEKTRRWSRILHLFENDSTFGAISFLTVLCIMIYFCLQLIDSSFNATYGGDRTKNAFGLIRFWFMIIPYFLNNYLLHYLPVLVRKIKMQGSMGTSISLENHMAKPPSKIPSDLMMADTLGSNCIQMTSFHNYKSEAFSKSGMKNELMGTSATSMKCNEKKQPLFAQFSELDHNENFPFDLTIGLRKSNFSPKPLANAERPFKRNDSTPQRSCSPFDDSFVQSCGCGELSLGVRFDMTSPTSSVIPSPVPSVDSRRRSANSNGGEYFGSQRFLKQLSD